MKTIFHQNGYDDYSGPDFHNLESGYGGPLEGCTDGEHVVILSLTQLEAFADQAGSIALTAQALDVNAPPVSEIVLGWLESLPA